MGTIKTTSAITLCSLLASTATSLAEPSKSARFAMNDTESFVKEKVSVFAINRQEYDAFGKPQDPNRKAVKPAAPSAQAKPTMAKKEQRILLAKEIGKLGEKITVMGQRLLIGNDSYKKRDQIKVSVKGKTFPLKIMKIERSKITFLNLTDQEFISLDLNNGAVLQNGKDATLPDQSGKTYDLDK